MMKHGVGMRRAWKSEDYNALRQHREAMQGMQDRAHAITTGLEPPDRTTLEALGAEAKLMIAEGRTGGRWIVEKWLAAHKVAFDHCQMPPVTRHNGSLRGMTHGEGDPRVVRFML